MTLEEIKQLKIKIDENIEELESKYLYAQLVSSTIETLLRHKANDSMVNVWQHTMHDFVINIQKELKNIEKNQVLK